MEYTSEAVAKAQIAEIQPNDVHMASGRSLVRRLRLSDFAVTDGRLDLVVEGASIPLSIRANHTMVFGGEGISALDYLKRVLERGDMIDAVVRPPANDRIPVDLFWIHIVYVGEPQRAGAFSKKEDGLFAMRAKSGEKAERIVAKKLRDDFGHSFPQVMLATPGYFEIRYDEKKVRKPDRKCTACGLTFEIKKRNRDRFFRVSHSPNRPFAHENHPDGWHAFVFPDMKPRFMSNAVIANAIASGLFDAGSDKYDSWAHIRSEAAVVSDPPVCQPDPPIVMPALEGGKDGVYAGA
ncbi:hypothetical protein [Ralstonia pseudosolanacearum]|uniref:hypothetical protein n=1 Tax=Ralstonia pseudosolanacearum TaxID=1310165 RepID=UPI001FF897D5|nr:hypothetical protein [Ralstonia pseudosolanacearum]